MSDGNLTLMLEKREVLGKQVRGLRTQGIVPAVIHDHGKDSVHVMAPYQDVIRAYREAGKNQPVQLQVGKQHYMAMIKDVDFEPKKHTLRHVVFNAVKANEKVEAEVPVHIRFEGDNESTPAEKAGLIVLRGLETVEVKALPSKLPEVLTFSGEGLENPGDSVTVAELEIPEGVEIVTEPEQVLATVYEPSALQAANEEAGGAAEAEAPAEAEPTENAGDESEGSPEEKAEA